VDDWRFTTPTRIAIQVHAVSGSHAVTIWCAQVDGQQAVARRAADQKLAGWVDENPDVRLRIGVTCIQ
jgi:hypothetical protein